MQIYKNYIKRLFDILAAIIGLLLTFPLLLTSVIILYIFNNGEVFFFQRRPGKNGVIFRIYKLKTMLDIKDHHGNLLPEAERLTPIGRFIRKYSLDEIPQLFNILKGDMSLVGPRPLLPEYLPLYNDFQKKRHDVKPGITGWAQINGRNAISWEQKFEYDVWYVDRISPSLDIKILLLTLLKVIRKEGVNQKENITMEAFKGSDNL